MRKTSALFLLLGIASASLSSCSRSSYSFNNTAPAYLGSENVSPAAKLTPASAAASAADAAPVAAETLAATTAERAPAAQPSAAHEAATALAQRLATAAPAAKDASAATTATAPQGKLTHATRKALRQELKRQLANAPEGTQAASKSQLAALLLAIFLGSIGVHRFYLGYTGRGLLYIGLYILGFVTLFLAWIPLLVLVIIDIVKIATGSLKPRSGEYAKPL